MKLTKLTKDAIVLSIMNDVPKPDRSKRHAAVQAALVKAMSPECRKVFNRTPDVFEKKYAGNVTYDGVRYATQHVCLGDAPKDELEKVLLPYKNEDEALKKANAQLEAAILGCTTLKQLEDLLPEFKKYYPTAHQPTKNLPALANVVADLAKLGWPKK
jgi:hypothetical protein